MRQLQHTILWQNIDEPGMEYCHLSSHDEGWQLTGTALLSHNDDPLQVRYQVLCNFLWQTRTVNLVISAGASQRTIRLIVDKGRRWWIEEGEAYEELIALRGCVDVDLGISPATNTLPIRRKPLDIGDSIDVTAAWIRFPEVEIEPLRQRYTRLTKNRYRYESGNGNFTTEIEVDDMGLVTHYPDNWERIAVQAVGELLYSSFGSAPNE